jgi:hypothetical protein
MKFKGDVRAEQDCEAKEGLCILGPPNLWLDGYGSVEYSSRRLGERFNPYETVYDSGSACSDGDVSLLAKRFVRLF